MEPPREQSPEQQRHSRDSDAPRQSRRNAPGAGPRRTGAVHPGGSTPASGGAEHRRALRSRWRGATLASGWPFPGDWYCTAIDRVCDAALHGEGLEEEVGRLAAQRAESGIGLDETLRDLTVLHAVLSGGNTGSALVGGECEEVPPALLRRAALAWADVVAGRSVEREVTDALTGLTTRSYLRMRLYEVYRETGAARAGGETETGRDSYELLVTSLRLPHEDVRWSRLMGVVLAADVLREVFDRGETVSLLRESTPVVLTRNDPRIVERRRRAESAINARMRADPELRRAMDESGRAVSIRELRLPAEYSGACELLDSLS
ncbi:hypothetical protein SAMN04487905_10171 [Actinopolyspora xinjiangensis]|uniref:Uncharacterized protein n=1 Tax=Actinopolyspora xinjiangensis TaxID=405564 RepID=A0A1H0NBJ2_9ACTN|nr:hypothetical protein [Actinopolyspora xinjiangensis]SDO90013.1 hypothetical protein SAMN04487905_10171 [Actinopolyspora xinjiangensis]